MKHQKYQDYVISEGKLIGEFEEMYQDHSDPWNQSSEIFATDKAVTLHYLKKYRINSCVEAGCGLGYFTNQISKLGIDCLGTDISTTAISKAKKIFPQNKYLCSQFSNFKIFNDYQAILMLEITWYILDELKDFLEYFNSTDKYLIHTLTTYQKDKQSYGKNYFSDSAEILSFMDLNILEHGMVTEGNGITRNFFIATKKTTTSISVP